MMLCIGVEQSPDHALVLCVVFTSLSLKVLDASFAQSNSHLDSFIPKNKFFGARQEIRNDFKVSEGFVRIFYFPAHRGACLSSSTRLRKFESGRCET